MKDINERFIEGRIVNLEKEPIENLEKYAKEIKEKEESLKYDLDGIINEIISEK